MLAEGSSRFIICPEIMIPELLERYPQARVVLDKYGLRGCGGVRGPYESLHFFARAHDINEELLLKEIEELIADNGCAHGQGAKLNEVIIPAVEDTIYRRFFVAGIAVMLTFGASWGTWLLWKIGLGGSFAALSVNEVNAHGQAQVFGWMGLFIMGFAYQAFPRFWHTTLAKPLLAVVAFWLMLSGVVCSAASSFFIWDRSWLILTNVGLMLEFVAVVLFAGQIVATRWSSKQKFDPSVGFIFSALSWFVLSTAYNGWHTWNTISAVNDEQVKWLVSVFQGPLRDMQFHGLAMSMIFGVSLRTLPYMFNLPKGKNADAWLSLVLLNLAVALEVVLYIIFRSTENHIFAQMLLAPWLMLFGAAWLVVAPWKLWRPFPEADRSNKFIRAAYAWLFVTLTMLLALPAYKALGHLPLSHAYLGATRHAITVGFISLMIMGYAAKVVPTLNGIDTRKLNNLWGPFVLVNLGCALRVSMQILTDWYQGIFPIMGVSGILEIAGFSWWGVHLLRIIWDGKKEMDQSAFVDHKLPLERPAYISLDHKVADVLLWYPESESIFIAHGFGAITNPVLRRTVARQVTLRQACTLHNVPMAEFIQDLNTFFVAKNEKGKTLTQPCS